MIGRVFFPHRPHVDFTLYVNGFGSGSKQLMAIGMWFCLQTAVLLVYPAFMVCVCGWVYMCVCV